MQGLRNTNLNRCKNYRFIMRLRNYSEASNSSNTIYFTLTLGRCHCKVDGEVRTWAAQETGTGKEDLLYDRLRVLSG